MFRCVRFCLNQGLLAKVSIIFRYLPEACGSKVVIGAWRDFFMRPSLARWPGFRESKEFKVGFHMGSSHARSFNRIFRHFYCQRERGSFITEYAVYIQILFFVMLVAVPTLRGDVETVFDTASQAMNPPMQVAMQMTSTGAGGGGNRDGVSHSPPSEPTQITTTQPGNSEPNNSGGGEDNPNEMSLRAEGGGTMGTNPNSGATSGTAPPDGMKIPEDQNTYTNVYY